MRHARLVTTRVFVAVVFVAVAAFMTASSASSARAFAGKVDCNIEAGDVPGLTGDVWMHGTARLLPSGAVTLSCGGQLPPNVKLTHTFVRDDLQCILDDLPGYADTWNNHLVATPSGRVDFTCRWEPPTPTV